MQRKASLYRFAPSQWLFTLCNSITIGDYTYNMYGMCTLFARICILYELDWTRQTRLAFDGHFERFSARQLPFKINSNFAERVSGTDALNVCSKYMLSLGERAAPLSHSLVLYAWSRPRTNFYFHFILCWFDALVLSAGDFWTEYTLHTVSVRLYLWQNQCMEEWQASVSLSTK